MRMGRIAGATAVLALTTLTAVGAGAEDNYPTRVVKVIVPLTPGSQPELGFRVIGEKLQARWGQPVVVEARPGASQNIGADAVARAEPDGYTLLFTPPAPLVTSKWLYKKLSFDPDAFTPVLVAFQSSLVLTINPKVPASNLAELIAYAKANPGKLTYAHPGVTSVPYLAMGALLRRAGISVVPVAYTSLAQGQRDLVAGHIDMIMDPSPTRAMAVHVAGKLKVLAVAGARDPLVPGVPAIAEVLPGFEFAVWFGLVAPPKTPAAIADKLSREITETLRMPDVAKRLAQLGYNPMGSTPADMAALIRKDNDYWREAIEAVGMTKSK
ncbi:MAG: tripartite tricarboxylate transporter substrate binding protein [Hyphomicrobiaceae bacterium]